MVDQEDITTLTRHVRSFSLALKELRESFMIESEHGNSEDIQRLAHNKLGEVVSILKGVILRYPTLNPTEILNSAGIIIRKVKEHNYNSFDEPEGFFETTDQLALAFSNSVSDYLEEDLSQRVDHFHTDVTSLENLQGGGESYEEFYDKRNSPEIGGDLSEFFEENSERAESEESLDKIDSEGGKTLPLNFDSHPVNESDQDKLVKPDLSLARAEELDKALISLDGSVDISLQRTKVWSKYAKEIISYMERRAHIESDYCKQLTKLAQATKAVITEESYLPFQSTYVTALEYDINFAKKCQEKLQTELKGKTIEQLTLRRNEHDRIRSKLKEKWNKECKKLNDSIINLKKSKSLYIQKQQELKKFVDKQEREEGGQSSSVVPSFSIGKKKKEEDMAKRAEEAEEYYKKCIDEANMRQNEIEKTRESVLLDLRYLVYQCDMTMRSVTHGYFQMMECLAAHLPQQYSALAKDSKQSEVGKQFAEFIKLQQATSKKSTPKRFSFEIYQADDRTDSDKGYIGPADFLNVCTPDADLSDHKESPNPKRLPRRISTNSNGSDASINRPPSPTPPKKRQNAWTAPNRYSNSDDTASVSSRSLPGSPSASPSLGRKETSQRLSLSNTEIDVREEFKKELAGPFRNLKMSNPAQSHKFKKLRSSSKCKNCDSYVYFNGAECELCGLTCHKKCLETLAIKCGKSRLPRKMTTFGVDFQKHLDATQRQNIPIIMEKCITEIDLRCLQIRGIYRLSGVKTKVEALSQQFEIAGSAVDLQSTNPNLITSVLKLYLRELPEPLMTFDLYAEFILIAKDSSGLKFDRPEDGDAVEQCNEENDRKCEDILKRLHECILKLPRANYFTVLRLFKHLRRVANNEVFNQMSCYNLAVIFGPTLLKPRGSPSSLSALMDMTHQVRVVELLLMDIQILEESFKIGKVLEEEKEDIRVDTQIEAKEPSKGSPSTQSEQDLGYNTQPDQLDDARQELSLSDELQINFPDMFKRTDSRGKDLASSFGSLDSVPDMSPDIDDELKDLVLRTPLPDRPKSLDFDDRDKVSSPQNLRSGSESNLSFDSMSPVELPDSSIDFGADSLKNGTEIIGSIPVEDGASCAKGTPPSSRARRTGQISIDPSDQAPSQGDKPIDCSDEIEKEYEILDIADGGDRLAQGTTTPRAGFKGDSVQDNSRNEVDVDLMASHDTLSADQAVSRDQGVSKVPEGNGSDEALPEKIVLLEDIHCEKIAEESYGNDIKESNSTEYRSDGNEAKVPIKKTFYVPLSLTISSSARSKKTIPCGQTADKNEVAPKEPPCVAPKPMSPIRGSELSREVMSQEVIQRSKISSAKKEDENESEGDVSLNISGNTKKLRDRFIAGSENPGNERRGSTEASTVKDTSTQSIVAAGETTDKSLVSRTHSSTAKLVERFTKETEKRADGNSDSPMTRRGVSVRAMLKQFESGDEMDEDDVQAVRKKSGQTRDKDAHPSNSAVKSGSGHLPRENKHSNSSKLVDEKIRSGSEPATKREPKFV